MGVNSVSTGLAPSYGIVANNNSQAAKSAAFARRLPDKTFSQDVEVESVTQATSAGSGDTIDVGQLQDTLAKARRASADSATAEESGWPGGRSPPGIALYQRISQYGNNEPSTSQLLKSWNNIVQGGQDGGGAVAAFAKTLSQNAALPFESGILDLTA